jgi:hypothetical protein
MSDMKTAMVTVKITPSRLEEFRIAATLRGTTMSSLISQFIAKVVREEQAAVPQAFQRRGPALGTPTNHLNGDLNDAERTN